jgi:anti-anti-sigma factor
MKPASDLSDTRASVRREGSTTVLDLSGVLNASSRGAVLDGFQQALADHPSRLLVNLNGVDRMDGGGLSLLVRLAVQSQKAKVPFVVSGLGEGLRAILVFAGLPEALLAAADAQDGGRFLQAGWAKPVDFLHVASTPKGATNLNVDNRRALGPLQGFGALWQKTYRVSLAGAATTPARVVQTLKEDMPKFQPEYNHFYASPAGVQPGEVLFINATTLGLPVTTGVIVLHADETSFTLMTPQGHPESGWVTFSAFDEGQGVVAQIQSLARAGDPMYEMGLRLLGAAKVQETIWKHVLGSLAKSLGVDAAAELQKECLDPGLQWSRIGNVWYNSPARTILYRLTGFLRPREA